MREKGTMEEHILKTGFEPIVPDVGARPKKKGVKKVNPNAKPCSKLGCKVIDARHYCIAHLKNGIMQAIWSCGRHLNNAIETLNHTDNLKSIEVVRRDKVTQEVQPTVPSAKLHEFSQEAP